MGAPRGSVTTKGLKWDLQEKELCFFGYRSCFNRTTNDYITITVNSGVVLALIYLLDVHDCGTINPVNALFNNPKSGTHEQIKVVDPTHALFGKCFQVLEWRNSPGNAVFVYVAYKHNTRLYIPIEATNLAFISNTSATKLTSSSIQALTRLGKEIPNLCHNKQEKSGTDKPKSNKNKS